MAMSYFDDNEARLTGLPYRRRPHGDRGKSDRNEIVCRNCGADACYWYQMPTADGMGERPVLFDGTGKRHVCPPVSADDFEAQ